MDKDTPRYGSRDKDDRQRYSDDARLDDDRDDRSSYTPSRYSDDEDESAITNKPLGTFSRDDFSRDEHDDDEPPRRRGRFGSLEGLRSSNYEPDELRDNYESSSKQDSDSYLGDSSFDTERSTFRSKLSSSFGDTDRPSRNPLLRTDPSERKFSWEQDTPSSRLGLTADRDFDNTEYRSRRSRLDDLASRRAERSSRLGLGSDEADDGGYTAPVEYDEPARPTERYDVAEPEAEYQRERPTRDSYRREDADYDTYDSQPYEAQSYDNPSYDNQSYDSQPYETQPYETQPYEAEPYQGVHARELADVDGRQARDYQYDDETAAPRPRYGGFEQDFPQFEQPYGEYQEKRKRGPFLLLGSLLGVAVIAGGLIFVYQQGLTGGQNETVPVVTIDDTPIKVEPTEPSGVNISRKTKLIYDRIVGEETQSNDTLVPREEVPLPPSDGNQSNTIPAPDANTATITPSVTTEESSADVTGSEPLPLPLPPPPAGSQLTDTEQTTAESSPPTLGTGGQIVEPTGLNEPSEPPAPASQEILTVAEPAPPAENTQQAEQPEQPDEVAQLITSPPLPKEKPTPPSLQAEPGVAVPTGPIQIAPLPGSIARDTTTNDQTATDQTSPVQLQPTTSVESTTQRTQRRVTSGRFGEELVSGTTSAFTEQDTQVAVVDTQTQTQIVIPTPTPAPGQQEAPITGGRYLIQLAAFRSEEEAKSEFQKLQGRHPSLLGTYTSLIQQADLGTRGVYYRLRIGPIETKSNASQLCNSLIAAGERDCLVRQR